jgi:hypothetical protein
MVYGTMRQVTSEGVTGTLCQPVADVLAQLAANGGRNVGTIGNATHLWNNGAPRTVANRRHGDHTPWSADGPAGFVMAVDVKSLPGLSPVDLWHRFVTPCVKAGLYPEFKYGISDYVLRDSRPPFNMRDQKGGDGPGWLHLSFRPSHVRAHSTLIADAVAWDKAGRPSPVAFVKRLRTPPKPPPKEPAVSQPKYDTFKDWYGDWFGPVQSLIHWWTKTRPVELTANTGRDQKLADLRDDVDAVSTNLESLEARVAALEPQNGAPKS